MISIAQYDKQLMDLQDQIEAKEAQMRQDYLQLKRDLKHNPYLQYAIDHYKTHLVKEKKEKKEKIKALTLLIRSLEGRPDSKTDIIDIKREIINIKRNNNKIVI